MFLTGKILSRRTVLKGLGATVALPFLDAMVPSLSRSAYANAPARRAVSPVRLICIEQVHGAAGSSPYGLQHNLWSPAVTGRAFDLSPTSLKPLEPFRDHLTIISNTDVPSAEPTDAREIGGDHFRSSATYLTQAYPKRTEGADVECGVSLDQLHAQRFGQDTPIPSMQLCIESVDQSGGCGYGYSCVYTDTISWASPNKPLPMIRDPRVVFDQMFGVLGAGSPTERRARRQEDLSILDFVRESAKRLQVRLGPADRARLTDYLDHVREIERRLQAVEKRNDSGEPRALPSAPRGIPDSFAEHVTLMFDLQMLAFRSDITRVFSFKMGRDGSNRVYPESGSTGAFHIVSHHGDNPDRIRELAKINTYHVSLLTYLLKHLQETTDGDATMLDNSVVIYGSPMGNPNQHNHKRVPFLIAGHAGGRIKGGLHLKAKTGTPLSNVMLSLLHTLGHDGLESFGDSEGTFSWE
ncbi:MAG TPA: DUF1552 domain-containing protein [Vicinamibacterales bacterium]|nr:DUF1552 domain-containing protein [Vicinamibacterales bacterium]